MQLDADEDGEPFFKPPAVAAAPIQRSGKQVQGTESEEGPKSGEHTQVEGGSEEGVREGLEDAAAVDTADQEE